VNTNPSANGSDILTEREILLVSALRDHIEKRLKETRRNNVTIPRVTVDPQIVVELDRLADAITKQKPPAVTIELSALAATMDRLDQAMSSLAKSLANRQQPMKIIRDSAGLIQRLTPDT